jgi:enoyl-CoA hydratase/carnithine racemase
LPIDYQKRDGVAYITLNNPAKANILDKKTSDEISEAWIDLWEDRAIRCAILTGAGDKHFCGGHNLAPRPDVTQEEREYLRTQRIYWPRSRGASTGRRPASTVRRETPRRCVSQRRVLSLRAQ